MKNKPQRTKRNFRWPITLGLLLGAICVTAFAFMYKLPTVYKFEKESFNIPSKQPNYAFLSVATQSREAVAPYLKTGFDDIFYTISNDNSVTFYRYSGGKFGKIKTTETIRISLPHDDSDIDVNISILENDDVREGYGVFTDTKSTTLPYVFVKLTDNNVTDDNYDYLIYADYSIDDFYKNNKTYSMVFATDKAGRDVKPVFSNEGAPIGSDGLISDTFTLVPDNLTFASADAFYYLTDRNYQSGTLFDLYRKDKVTGTETLVCEEISSPNLFVLENDIHFFLNSSDKNEFNLCKLDDDEPIIVSTFSGNSNQYTVRGNYIFNASSKTLYNLETGTKSNIRTSISINTVQDFAVNESGTRFALAGNFAGNTEKLLFYGLKNDRLNVIDGSDLFVTNHSNLAFVGECIYLVMPSPEPDKILDFVISWDAIFSLN